jgi:transposase-like protein
MVDRDVLRGRVESAAAAAFARDGDAMSSVALVKQFSGMGASQATLYRWVRAAIQRGLGSAHVSTPPLAMAVSDAAPVGVAVPARWAKPPAQVPVGNPMPPVLEQLEQCITAAQRVMAYASNADGTVRNSKLLLNASENLRRAVETSVKLHDAVMDVLAVERFHQAVFDVLRDQSPALAEAVVVRLRDLNAEWSERLRT